jgi:hypothetical protein
VDVNAKVSYGSHSAACVNNCRCNQEVSSVYVAATHTISPVPCNAIWPVALVCLAHDMNTFLVNSKKN